MDPDGRWTSTRAVLLAAAGQNCWPPAGSYMAATGQDLMAADILEASANNPPGATAESPATSRASATALEPPPCGVGATVVAAVDELSNTVVQIVRCSEQNRLAAIRTERTCNQSISKLGARREDHHKAMTVGHLAALSQRLTDSWPRSHSSATIYHSASLYRGGWMPGPNGLAGRLFGATCDRRHTVRQLKACGEAKGP